MSALLYVLGAILAVGQVVALVSLLASVDEEDR